MSKNFCLHRSEQIILWTPWSLQHRLPFLPSWSLELSYWRRQNCSHLRNSYLENMKLILGYLHIHLDHNHQGHTLHLYFFFTLLITFSLLLRVQLSEKNLGYFTWQFIVDWIFVLDLNLWVKFTGCKKVQWEQSEGDSPSGLSL